MKIAHHLIAPAACIAISLAPARSSESIIADAFEPGPSQRQEGAPLAGSDTLEGGAMWEGIPSTGEGIVFTGSGEVTAGSARGMGASVALPLDAGQIKVSADVMVPGSDWCGVALGGEKMDQNFFLPGAGAQVFLLLRPGGMFSVFCGVGKKAQLLAEAKAPSFLSKGFNTLALTYNAADNSVSASVNDTEVLREKKIEEPLMPVRAGIHINHPPVEPGLPRIDNFKVSISRD